MTRVRHLLSLDELSAQEIMSILEDAVDLRQSWVERKLPKSLGNQRVALIVDDTGWRNTFAFELGVESMGGVCAHAPISLSSREDSRDLAKYLENWCDCVVVRTPDLEELRCLANAISIPVINARTRSNHPCETLGDLAYLVANGKSLEGLKVTVVSPKSNILHSWIEASRVLPIHVRQVFDAEYLVSEEGNERFFSTDEFDLTDSDVIVTDVWPDLTDEKMFSRYRVTGDALAKAGAPMFIPCPPVHRGKEVSECALQHSSFCSYAAKEYLLHAQNAVLRWALSREDQ